MRLRDFLGILRLSPPDRLPARRRRAEDVDVEAEKQPAPAPSCRGVHSGHARGPCREERAGQKSPTRIPAIRKMSCCISVSYVPASSYQLM